MAEENPLLQHLPHFQLHGVLCFENFRKLWKCPFSVPEMFWSVAQQSQNHTSLGEGSTQIISGESLLWWTSCFSHKFSCEAPLKSCLTYSRGTGTLFWSVLLFLQDLLKSNVQPGLSKKCIRGHRENLDPGTLFSCLVNMHSFQPLMGTNLHPLLSKHLQIF